MSLELPAEPDGAVNKLSGALVSKLLGVIDEGLGPFQGARAYADARRATFVDVERTIERIENETMTMAGLTGFATGVGGLATLVVSLPANISVQAVLNARMVAAIAYLRGWDIDDEIVRNSVLIAVAGGTPNAVLSKFGVHLGQKVAEQAIKQIPIHVIRQINARAGFMLLAKYGTSRSMLTLAKAVPIAGGVVGGSVDAVFTGVVSRIAKHSFPAADSGSTQKTDGLPGPPPVAP